MNYVIRSEIPWKWLIWRKNAIFFSPAGQPAPQEVLISSIQSIFLFWDIFWTYYWKGVTQKCCISFNKGLLKNITQFLRQRIAQKLRNPLILIELRKNLYWIELREIVVFFFPLLKAKEKMTRITQIFPKNQQFKKFLVKKIYWKIFARAYGTQTFDVIESRQYR